MLKQIETKSRAPSQSIASLVRHAGLWTERDNNKINSFRVCRRHKAPRASSVSRPCWYSDALNPCFQMLDHCWRSLPLALLFFIQDALEIRFDQKKKKSFVPDKEYVYCGITLKPRIGFSSMKKNNSNNLSRWDFSRWFSAQKSFFFFF